MSAGLPGRDDQDAPLALCVDDDEGPTLHAPVETKAILAVVDAGVWLVDCLRVEEGLGCEAEVEAAFFENLVAFVRHLACVNRIGLICGGAGCG